MLSENLCEQSSSASSLEKESHQGRVEPLRFRTTICRHYRATGFCPYAPRCLFAHGDHELRSTNTNTTDGITDLSRLREAQDAYAKAPRSSHQSAPRPSIPMPMPMAATCVPMMTTPMMGMMSPPVSMMPFCAAPMYFPVMSTPVMSPMMMNPSNTMMPPTISNNSFILE
eukprot:PhM_4_TR12212/c0_g1_i1/m.29186